MIADPGSRSDARGAASAPRKIVEGTRRDEERLTHVEAELRAAHEALARLDEREAAKLRRQEEAVLADLRGIAEGFVERFGEFAGLLEQHRNTFGVSDGAAAGEGRGTELRAAGEPGRAAHDPPWRPGLAPAYGGGDAVNDGETYEERCEREREEARVAEVERVFRRKRPAELRLGATVRAQTAWGTRLPGQDPDAPDAA